jgi:hypothetical protein
VHEHKFKEGDMVRLFKEPDQPIGKVVRARYQGGHIIVYVGGEIAQRMCMWHDGTGKVSIHYSKLQKLNGIELLKLRHGL